MQGNCTAEVPRRVTRTMPGTPLLPLLPRQCLVVTDRPIVAVQSALWISNVVLRTRDTGRGSAVTFLQVNPGNRSALWVSDSALQGDGVSTSSAVYVEGRAHFLSAQPPTHAQHRASAR